MSDGVDRVMFYRASKTMARFHASNAFMRLLMGPIGSGKSVACANEVFRRACLQNPNMDGVRRTKVCVVRNTYRQLGDSTIKTWLEWFPQDKFGRFKESTKTHEIRFALGDGTSVCSDIVFRALDRPEDRSNLLSVEYSYAWMNEAREIPYELLVDLRSRLGRFPPEKEGAKLTWCGIVADTNPPDTDNWIYMKFEEERVPGWEIYKQPGALIRLENKDGTARYVANPDAENVEHHQLGYDYWLNQLSGNNDEWIKVYCLGQYGTSLDGKPVFPEYRDHIHCKPAEKMVVYGSRPMRLGWDFGRTPACVVAQESPSGAMCVHREYTSDGMSLREFVRDVVGPDLRDRYPGAKFLSFGDPSGGDGQQGEEGTLFDILREEGFPTLPGGAKSNRIEPRREAVSKHLLSLRGDEAGFLLSDECRVLRRGFLGGYRYRRVMAPGEYRFKDLPEKNSYSHPHDALQYLCLGGTSEVVSVQRSQRREVRVKRWM